MPAFFFIQATFSFLTRIQSVLDFTLRLMVRVSLLLLRLILDIQERQRKPQSLSFLHLSSLIPQESVVRAAMERVFKFW